MTTTPADIAQDLAAATSDVAATLYTVDSGADVAFVRAQAQGGDAVAASIVGSLDVAWAQYPLAKDASDRLTAAVGARDRPTVDVLLGPAAVTLPDGTTTALASLLRALRDRVNGVAGDVARLAEAARTSLAALDAASVALQELRGRAGPNGAGEDVEIRALRDAIDAAAAAIAAAPGQRPDLTGLDRAVAAARARVEFVERSRNGLPGALAAAATRLQEITALAEEGAAAFETAAAKIVAPAGVCAPLDPSAGGDQALGPWLARIQEQAENGSWEAATTALEAWQREAATVLAEAQRIAAANVAPVARRNELRGLLDAYQAKGAATGHDEDLRLAGLYQAAKDALYTAPCALDRAEGLVRDYIAAVNAGGG